MAPSARLVSPRHIPGASVERYHLRSIRAVHQHRSARIPDQSGCVAMGDLGEAIHGSGRAWLDLLGVADVSTRWHSIIESWGHWGIHFQDLL